MEFTRKVRLVEYFEGNKDDNDESLVRNKSHWIPPKGRDSDLEAFVTNVTDIPLTPNDKSKIKHNLSKSQHNSIKSLALDDNIIIKEADKGGATVIMNKSFYQSKIEDMLSNQEYYEQLDNDPHKPIMATYKKLVHKYENNITKKEFEYLTVFETQPSNFYGLPKIHKSKEINEACTISQDNYVEIDAPENLNFRPIVAGPICETHRLSNFIDILLQPYSKHVKSYIKDTTDFLSKLPQSTDSNAILVSFDVENLYTNIPHKLGIEAIQFWLEKYPQELPARIDKNFILEGIKFILENNYFCFNEKHFLQKKGTAMGTKFAPIFSTLVLGYLEEKLYANLEKEFGCQFKQYIIDNFKRFLDDCFILFTHSDDDLKKLHKCLNKLHPSIKYTMEQNKSQLPFLDTLIINNRGKIQTDIFYKPTDSKQYLLYTSCHPKHTRNSIPYNLARRLKMIVSEETTLNSRLNELKIYLTKRKYPLKLIEDAIAKVHFLDRRTLLSNHKKSEESDMIPYVTTFNPNNPEIYPNIKQFKSILQRNHELHEIFRGKVFLKSKRQPPNLKRLLTKARFTNKPKEDYKVSKCNEPRCGLCKYITEGSLANFKGKLFKVKDDMSCKSKYVIYMIQCRGCDEQYIGETVNLRNRITLHNQHIRHAELRKIPVSGHIADCSDQDPKYFVFPFYLMKTESIMKRKEKEKYFIRTFLPKLNSLY